MTATSPVVASSPFLTVDQAAAELGLHPNAIPRLIGLKALDGLRQPNSGEWKVLPAALTKFLAAGSPRGKNDLVDYDGAWYADRTLQSYAGQFENQVRDLLLSFFPATMPYGNIRHGDRRMLTLTAEQKNAIMSLGAHP